MTTVAQVLSSKKPAPLAVKPPSATVLDALKLMAERAIGSVLIMEGDALLGVFTERDYARRIVLRGLHSGQALLGDVMTTRLYVVHPAQSVQECLGLMTKARVRHLPVEDGGKVIGLVSIGDLVNQELADQRFMIAQLEDYIAGAR